jgi:Tol biopolymer transport system component
MSILGVSLSKRSMVGWVIPVAVEWAAILATLGCGDDGSSTGPATGSIEVTTSTTGPDEDPDGYTVSVDGGIAQAIGIDGTLTISQVPAGTRSVVLAGVAANCSVAGSNPLAVTVSAGATAQVAFSVTCSALAPPLSGKIAFETSRDGGLFEVYVMNADGTNPVNVSNNPARDFEPDWSFDGTKIAFASNRDAPVGSDTNEIYVMNADGSGQTRLTNNGADDENPDWSPDGTKIAFQSDIDGNFEVYVMNSDGTGLTNLTNNPADDGHPAWSPDGTKIAFHTDRELGDFGNLEVYVMNADGSSPVNLSNNVAFFDGRPAWSPDGAKIAFASDRDGNLEIYAMNADGSGQTRLTNDDELDSYPEWSPDGAHLAFRSDRAGNSEIFITNADGTTPVNVTNNPATDCHPTWTAAAGAASASMRQPVGSSLPAPVNRVRGSLGASETHEASCWDR